VNLARLSGLLALPFAPQEPKGLAHYWTYELLRIDGQPITVRKVVVGLVLLVLGYFASKVLSRIARRGLPRRMTEGAAATLESILFYVLLLMFGLSALNIAGVPLTAFTLLGGAAAIGIGFGSQNIVNNFISGLILLAERPVNVGDLIQLGELYGTVERIGPRSTRVRTGENVEIIVPNSAFLEQNVVNWTLTENRVRISVRVGVVYGSPTDAVRDLIHDVVRSHERVLKTPEPVVLFVDFGESSLDFDVHFWIEMKKMMDRRSVESDVRFGIDRAFREAGIVIAFPQRDVHLDSAKPLEVKMV
jgi:potassium efflux system protein